MEDEMYMKSIYKLHEKCQQIQRENERFVARLHFIKKLTKRQQKDVVLLKSRLDLYNDSWRTANPSAKVRRVPKKNKITNKSGSAVNTPSGTPTLNTSSTVRINSNGGAAAPITKRKRSSQTKRQSVSSRTNPELWKGRDMLDE